VRYRLRHTGSRYGRMRLRESYFTNSKTTSMGLAME
jgi:hypothetical protein